MTDAKLKAQKRSRINTIATSSIVALLTVASYHFLLTSSEPPNSNTNEIPQSVYSRIIDRGTLRVGYVSYPPATIVNPSGDRLTGIFPDLLRDIGERTDLRIEFVEEVGWATLIEGLQTRRYDIVGGLWANPARGKLTTVSSPVYYSGIGVWVRADDHRITPNNNWDSINREGIRVAAIDGSTPLTIVNDQFPEASLTTYPNLTTESQLFLDLINDRIDVFFAEPTQGLLFLREHPGSIRNLASSNPIRIFANVFLMRSGEFQLKTLIDTAIFDLQSSGRVEQMINEYEPAPGAFYRVAPPYHIPSETSMPQGASVTDDDVPIDNGDSVDSD